MTDTTVNTVLTEHRARSDGASAVHIPGVRWAIPLLIIGWCAWFASHAPTESAPITLLLGLALGITLLRANFGFTTAWRRLLVQQRGRAFRAHMLMLGAGCCLFFPALGSGEVFGIPVAGYVRPLGVSLIVGSFIFGIGMQLSDGCSSGNLYHLGDGRIKALPALLGFTVGAFYASLHYEWWINQPQFAPLSVIESWGVSGSLGGYLVLFAALAWLSAQLERRRHGALEVEPGRAEGGLLRRVWSGDWPLWSGALLLAGLNFATLLHTGRPWSIAQPFSLWGARVSEWLGINVDLDFAYYWIIPSRMDALYADLLSDTGTLMNLGVLLGALLAATLSNRFTLKWRLPLRQWIAAVLGGLLMGYGATIGFGCNIGALFSGMLSGSVHAWVWLLFALCGCALGIALRPAFALLNDHR